MWNWLTGMFTKKAQSMPTTAVAQTALKSLWWLMDAPLFIDELLVSGFYDAIVRPEFELQGKTIGAIDEKVHTLLTGGSAELGLALPSFLSFLGPNAKLTGKIERTAERTKQATEQYEWKAIHTAGRKLEELVAVYVSEREHHDRLIFMECPTSDIKTLGNATLKFDSLVQANNSHPRSLVFIDVKPGAVIIPTMCEFSGGGLEPLYEQLISRLWASEKVPKYPSEFSPRALEERREYWKSISERYDSRVAMEVLEHAMKDGRKLEWVDFRLPLNEAGDTVHLHVCPKGLYSAGTFGYNFIRRGSRKGARIVGSLKRGPDLNVLAIFEC